MFFKRALKAGAIVGLMTMLGGCGKDATSFSLMADSSDYTQKAAAVNNVIDILWVVDNSGSMLPYQTRIKNNFDTFIKDFKDKGYDFHVAVISSDAYRSDPTLSGYSASNSSLGLFNEGTVHNGNFIKSGQYNSADLIAKFLLNVSVGTGGSGDERLFSSFRAALNKSATTTNPFLRENSYLAVILVGDEDEFSGNTRPHNTNNNHSYTASTLDKVDVYSTYLDNLTKSTPSQRRYSVSAFTVLKADITAARCSLSGSAIEGKRLVELAEKTGGTVASICDDSYMSSFQALQKNINELSTQFYLSRVPDLSTMIVKVAGNLVKQDANNGWTYNSGANSIVFHGTSVPPQGANVELMFLPLTIKY